MTLPKDKQLKHEHIESMKIAVEHSGIRAIHPDKMEEFAEYLVQKARQSEQWHKKGCDPSFFVSYCIQVKQPHMSKRWTANVFVNSEVGEIPVEVYASTWHGAKQQIHAKHGDVQQICNLRESPEGSNDGGSIGDMGAYLLLGAILFGLWLIIEFWWIIIPISVIGAILYYYGSKED